jgi:hypothetical protein
LLKQTKLGLLQINTEQTQLCEEIQVIAAKFHAKKSKRNLFDETAEQ